MQKKRTFFKSDLDTMECQNKCLWRILSWWWHVLALLKCQNALKMGYFETKKLVNNGSKIFFEK